MYNPLLTPELFAGLLPPAAQPVQQVQAPASAPLMPGDFMSQLANIGINPMFMGTNLGSAMPSQSAADLRIDPATGLTLNKARTVELDETGRVAREITPEGSTPGLYFDDDRGMPATTGLGEDARFTPLDPNAVYTAVNEVTGEVVSEGVGAEGLKAAQTATSQLSEAGRKADWAVVKTDPVTGAASAVANVDPRQSELGKFADAVLPVALAFTPLGPVAGAAAGSGISSVAQGRSLEETLKRAAISGAASAVGSGVVGELSGGTFLGGVKGALPGALGPSFGGGFGGAGFGAPASTASEIIVQAGLNPAQLAGNALSGLGGGTLANIANMPAGRGADLAERGFNDPAAQDPAGNVINVTASQPAAGAPLGVAELAALGTVPVAAATASAPSDGLGDATPEAEKGDSLLDDIIKYYSLGSAGLDLLGGALGGSGQGAAAAPYTSRLGAMPTFGRGEFTPFTGDYETYGFGPEFNFFGDAPAPTLPVPTGPTAPNMGILPNPARFNGRIV